MHTKALHAQLSKLGVPMYRRNLFETAVRMVNTDQADAIIGTDLDGDDIIAGQLLDAYSIVASDYLHHTEFFDRSGK